MFDMHYDLLTYTYMCKLNNNLKPLELWCRNYNNDNVVGLIANLCFMSKNEMSLEYNKFYYNDSISIVKMFEESLKIVKKLIPNINVIYAIEGLDYLKNLDELEQLYNLGLRSVGIVWNEKNKYASGIRGTTGLTQEGIKLISKCIELGIGIDVSHANKKTFDDIINLIKVYRLNNIYPIVYASHSNSKKICPRIRNLDDEQIIKLKSVDGYIGIMSNRNFVYLDALNKKISSYELRIQYINHIKHIGSIIGYDHILLSSDDMSFSLGSNIYKELPIYNYSTIKNNIEQDLKKVFDEKIVDDILYKNSLKIVKKLESR